VKSHRPNHGREAQRSLTRREREILGFLLSVDTPGIAELRQQAKSAVAIPWDCGCASIDLIVDRETASASSIRKRPAIETTSKERSDASRALDHLLWVEDGWLSAIEIVDYLERHQDSPETFPPPSDFDPPLARPA
jgi:hypothetical protein